MNLDVRRPPSPYSSSVCRCAGALAQWQVGIPQRRRTSQTVPTIRGSDRSISRRRAWRRFCSAWIVFGLDSLDTSNSILTIVITSQVTGPAPPEPWFNTTASVTLSLLHRDWTSGVQRCQGERFPGERYALVNATPHEHGAGDAGRLAERPYRPGSWNLSHRRCVHATAPAPLGQLKSFTSAARIG